MNQVKAIKYMLFSAFCFSIMQFFVKKTSGYYPVFEQVFMRNFIVLFFSIFMIKKDRISLTIKEGTIPLLIRCCAGYLGVVFFFLSIKGLNMADASALQKSSPFFVILFSSIFLKELISKKQIGIVCMAFLGVLFIVKPNFQFAPIYCIAAILSASTAGIAYVAISYMRNMVNSKVIIFYFSLFSCVMSIPLMLHNFVVPRGIDFINLLCLGLGGGIGQLYLTYSYKLSMPAKVSIYSFTNIIFSTILGYVFYKEKIDYLSMIGITIILICAIYNHYSVKIENT